MDNLSGLGCFGLSVYIAVVSVLGYLINGIVLSQLWHWFIAQTFQIKDLTTVQAIGISLVVGYLTHQDGQSKSDDKDRDWISILVTGVVKVVGGPLLVLFIGWIIQHWL